jgi:hypothetical protein
MLGDQLLAMKNFRALDDKKGKVSKTPFVSHHLIFISLIVPTGLWNCPATHFFNEMYFKRNYDQVFNDNDI